MGGMMNAAIVEVMRQTGHTLPEAHFDPRRMADLAGDVTEATGFENIGVPFCMTVEAEALGSRVDHGTLACEPKIAAEAYPSVKDVPVDRLFSHAPAGRQEVVARAAGICAERQSDLPVVVSLTGPISTAASIVDPIAFLKDLRRAPAEAMALLDRVADFLADFARLAAQNGADVIAIGDPTATGEILGPRLFAAYAVPAINRLADAIHGAGLPVIVHICGDMKGCRRFIPALHADAISTDATVSLVKLKEDFPWITTMGNVSTFLLENDTTGRAARTASRLVRQGVDIIAPACGLSTSTRLATIRAMTDAVRNPAPFLEADAESPEDDAPEVAIPCP
jgi:[methyl-Co(III) methanol-specific corrinoid protein]:coenzyme M methyltransferase